VKIRIYQSDKGDCLRIMGAGGGNILVDGGMRNAFVQHVRADLQDKIDLVYISHIDDDHIGGILELLNDVMEWRVYKYRAAKNPKLKAPKYAELPAIGEIWHNAFSDMLGKNAAPVENLLAQASLILGLSSGVNLRQEALRYQDLATSIDQALQVSRRVSASQLNIPLNQKFGGKLILVRPAGGVSARVAKMNLYVIGPFNADVEKLKGEWNDWLDKNKKRISEIKKAAEEDARSIGSSADRITQILAAKVDDLGNREKVTTPNLASVMLLLEEGARKVLLTGDGHWADILKGLEHHGKFDAQGKLHVDVLKVQHHGSEYNYKQEFADRVSADNYILCGNGMYSNPDPRVVDIIVDTHRARRPNDTFNLWFNCASDQAPAGKPRAHIKKIETQVAAKVKAAKGKVIAKFLKQSSMDLTL
jgi:beta-lactamase superfamily II metal-dependent hydrolase